MLIALLKYAFKASPFPKSVAKIRQTSVSKYEDKIIVVAIFKFEKNLHLAEEHSVLFH